MPYSAALLIAAFGALAAGWRTPWNYRWLLCVPSVGMLALLILTVVEFWPMNAALWRHATDAPNSALTEAEAAQMALRWVQLDWIRVAGGAAAFVVALRALTVPWPTQIPPRDPLMVRIGLAAALFGVVAFVVWFIASL